jgi:hypothetical protein
MLRRSIPVLALLGAAGLVLGGVPAAAEDDAPSHEVVATGLDNPRGLTVGPDGAVYVAESGAGGTRPCLPGPEGGPVCFGKTGAVTRIDDAGQTRVLTGLPSIATKGAGTSALGPSDVAFGHHGKMYVTVGLGLETAVAMKIPALADMGELVRARANGTWRSIADLAAFEHTANPTADERDSNPNSVFPTKSGFIVADAGGNDIVKVKRNGRIDVLATLPNRMIGGASVDEVPTSAVVGPDGALYVGQLTGFPFPAGAARVYRIDYDGDLEVFAKGFTNIIDIAFDEDENLYVLEISKNGLTSGDPTGALIRVDEDGDDWELVTDDLMMPGGLAIHGDHAYVSNISVVPGKGEVVRIDLDD